MSKIKKVNNGSSLPLNLQQKNKSLYTREIKKAINVFSIKKDNSTVFGSFTYRMQPFPSDIDVMEVYNVCCFKGDVINSFNKEFKKIIRRILNSNQYYFAEVKAGLDERFIIDIGNYDRNLLKGYNYDKIIKKLIDLHLKQLLTEKDLVELEQYVVPKPTFKQHEMIGILLRDKYILRWTANEILQGYKIIPPNKKLSFKSALKHKTMVKLDMIAVINCKLVEMSNFYILSYGSQPFQHLINLPEDYLTTFELNIMKDIRKVSFSPFYLNMMKLAKRLFSLARIRNDKSLLAKIIPILRSDLGLIYLLKSELDVILLAMDKLNYSQLLGLANIMINQIDNIKLKLGSIIEYNITENNLVNLFDKIINHLFQFKKTKNDIHLKDAYKLIKIASTYFKSIVNEETEKKLVAVKLYPPPMDYVA